MPTRRHFLQLSGAAALGLGSLDAQAQQSVLAQPGRKYALLVGINQYDNSDITNLKGCEMDVEMQYHLLRYRYGFAPENIRILTSATPEKPTRDNILRAFEQHLIAQVKPGDVAVFHYSGHGSLMQDPDPIDPKSPSNGTLIPMDCDPKARNDIMGKTLFLLSQRVQTDAFTMVLDSCHSGGGTRGSCTVRSLGAGRSGGAIAVPSPAELAYQARQLQQLGLNPAEFLKLRRAGIAKGVAIGSAQKEQLAVDALFADFHAGALTYLLTRYLWQMPTAEPLRDTFTRLALITREVAADSSNPQEPIQEVAPGKAFDRQPVYHTAPGRGNAEGVVTQIDASGLIQFWLGGVASSSLASYQAGSLFNVLDAQGQVVGEIEQTDRRGLVGTGRLKQGGLKQGSPPQAGMLLREKLRRLPQDTPLQVALSPDLKLDRQALWAELGKIAGVQLVEVAALASGGVLVGPLTAGLRTEAAGRGVEIPQSLGSVGLLSANAGAIAASFGPPTESTQALAARLKPKLKALLARKFLRQVFNSQASQLKVDVRLKAKTGADIQVLAGRQVGPAQALKAGSQLDINVTNQEAAVIYLAAISVWDTGELVVLHPSDWEAPEAAAVVDIGKTKQVALELDSDPGFFEIVVITSAQPLRETLRGLKQIAAARGVSRGYIGFDQTSRSGGESEDAVVESVRQITRDVTRAGDAGEAGKVMERRSLDPEQSGIFSTVLQAI